MDGKSFFTTTKKTTQGRKKIEIKKIEQVNNLQVTFSKRRAGLFKKASELCVLSGAEITIIVESPGKRVFSYGHRSADDIIDRFLTGNTRSEDSDNPTRKDIIKSPRIQEFNKHYSLLSKELETEKKRKVLIEESKMAELDSGLFWWDQPIDHLSLAEMEEYVAALEELKRNVTMRADELMLAKVAALPQ